MDKTTTFLGYVKFRRNFAQGPVFPAVKFFIEPENLRLVTHNSLLKDLFSGLLYPKSNSSNSDGLEPMNLQSLGKTNQQITCVHHHHLC